MTHICVIKLTIIASNNGLSPGRRQVIIWLSARTLLIRTFSEILSKIVIQEDAFENVVCEMVVILSVPQCVKLAAACPRNSCTEDD